MPYVVTTKRPDETNVGHGGGFIVTRRAVATLEGREVWNALYGVEIKGREDVVERIAALPESGGTVGAAIEVEPRDWMTMFHESGMGWLALRIDWRVVTYDFKFSDEAKALILAAFNEKSP